MLTTIHCMKHSQSGRGVQNRGAGHERCALLLNNAARCALNLLSAVFFKGLAKMAKDNERKITANL
jgi:hypothetical protein